MDSDFLEEHRIVRSVIDCLEQSDLDLQPQLVVRTYVKGTSSEMLALAEQKIEDVFFPPILWDKRWIMPQEEDLYIYNSLLEHAAMGINAASTVTLELMMYGKPVVNLGLEPPGVELPHFARFARHVDYEHYRPVVQSGGVMVARSVSELCQQIRDGLLNPTKWQPAQSGFLASMFAETLDGDSGVRVARQLLRLASCSQVAENAIMIS